MKTIIEKRADQLQPGDIIVKRGGARDVVVRAVEKDGKVIIYAATLGATFSSSPAVWPTHTTFDVESFERTPSQQHTDALLVAARQYLPMLEERVGPAEVDKDPDVIALRSLLAELAPPVPPTSEELADMLREMLLPPGPDTYARAKAMLRRRGGK